MSFESLAWFVALLVQGALVSAAVLHAREGRFRRLVRWATRLAVLGTLLVSIGAIYSAVWEITTFDYPWTRPGEALGTYAQPTGLGVSFAGLQAVWFVVAAAVAVRNTHAAAVLYAGGALTVFLSALRMRWFDATFPSGNFSQALFAVLPAIVVAILLWCVSGPLFMQRRSR